MQNKPTISSTQVSSVNTVYNFAFIKIDDVTQLEEMIVLINRARHQLIEYERIILTKARQGWVALIIDTATPDHYLLRNLSGRLNTTAFAFGVNGNRIFYRLQKLGRTISAYESDLGALVQQYLDTLISTGDVRILDLAEPAGRLVLRYYHEHQRSRAWTQQNSDQQKIPHNYQKFYQGQAEELRELFMPGVSAGDMQEILNPDVDADEAFTKMVQYLDLPYLVGDHVEMQKLSDDSPQSERIIKDYDILRPSTWSEGDHIPKDWVVLKKEMWKQE